MGLGETKMFPPNAERCVHKQCRFPLRVFHPTLKKKEPGKMLKTKVYMQCESLSVRNQALFTGPFFRTGEISRAIFAARTYTISKWCLFHYNFMR